MIPNYNDSPKFITSQASIWPSDLMLQIDFNHRPQSIQDEHKQDEFDNSNSQNQQPRTTVLDQDKLSFTYSTKRFRTDCDLQHKNIRNLSKKSAITSIGC